MAVVNLDADGPLLWDDQGSDAPVLEDGPEPEPKRRIYIV